MTRRHLAVLALAYVIFCGLYLGASLTGFREPLGLTPSAIDARVPFVGWTIWVYLSQFALLGFVFWKAADSPAWGRSLRSMLVATLLSVAVFVVMPTRLERAPIDGSAVTVAAFAALYLFDPPGNCFPSLHVSLALLGSLAFWPERRRLTLGCLAWAALIAASTLTTRQHVVIDVAAGAAVTVVAHWLTRWQGSRAAHSRVAAWITTAAAATAALPPRRSTPPPPGG